MTVMLVVVYPGASSRCVLHFRSRPNCSLGTCQYVVRAVTLSDSVNPIRDVSREFEETSGIGSREWCQKVHDLSVEMDYVPSVQQL